MLKKLFGKLFKSVDERAAEDEEYFKRTSNKYYKSDDTPVFEKGYFDGTGGQTMHKRRQEDAEREKRRKENRRTTTTTEGITIIDDRDANEVKRKIFKNDEGEYVEFDVVP